MSASEDIGARLQNYGVLYTPDTHHTVPHITIEKLRELGTHTVRLTWVDLTNTARFRAISIAYFSKLLEKSSRPGVTVAKACLGLVVVSLARGFSASEEYLYAIDMSSVRVCPYARGHASVMGWFQEKAPPPGAGLTVPLCPRTTLQRVVEDARKAGTTFLVGFETEFTLLKSTNPIVPVNDYGWSLAAAFLSGSAETEVMEEISSALQASGVELQMYHSEGAPGQYEIVTGPLPPLQAADALVHTREVIYNIANKHKLRATLAPRLYSDNSGSATHVHISVHPSPPTLGIPENAASFLSGLLAHLPALMALTLPIPASFARMVDGAWSGGTYVCWGSEAREAPVRVCNAFSPAARNFELRAIDGTANPYLALAGVLGVGIRGIKEKSKLETKDCTAPGELRSAAEMSDEERTALGITRRLPLSWEAAREEFGKDEVIRDVLGEELTRAYLNVNELFANSLKARDGETESDALARLIQTF